MANELVPDLWPPAPFTPTISQSARDSAATFGGAGLDVGALRKDEHGGVQVLVPSGWVQYDSVQHLQSARMFARYGPGWSPKFAANTHQNLIGAYEQVESHKQGKPVTLDPNSMIRTDLEFDAQAQAALLRELAELTGQGGKSEEVESLKRQLSDAIATQETLALQVTKLEGQVQDLQLQLAQKPAGDTGEELRKKIRAEVSKARGVLGKKPAGAWWQKYRATVEAVAKVAGE